ncbi:hypothetical protein IR145_15505 [Streptococcus danieliae]|nr:hypothetical protein [Streptococcus danieliae]
MQQLKRESIARVQLRTLSSFNKFVERTENAKRVLFLSIKTLNLATTKKREIITRVQLRTLSSFHKFVERTENAKRVLFLAVKVLHLAKTEAGLQPL